MIELLQPATPELARRWVAALLLVPAEEREGVVRAVEARIASTYGEGSRRREAAREEQPRSFDVVHPPSQREGFVEQVITTYEQTPQAHAPEAPPKSGGVPKAPQPRQGRARGA